MWPDLLTVISNSELAGLGKRSRWKMNALGTEEATAGASPGAREKNVASVSPQCESTFYDLIITRIDYRPKAEQVALAHCFTD